MILVFGDPHINNYHKFSQIVDSGYTIRELEHLQVSNDIVNLMQSQKFNAVVCLGDVFDKVGDKISIDNTRTVTDFIHNIQEECIKQNIIFYILMGNHDCNSSNGSSNKLIPFKYYKNIVIIDSPTEIENMIFLPHHINYEYIESFLEGIENKSDKIIFSHMELKDINLGNGIFTTKGVSLNILYQFKATFQGHYHTPGKYGKNVWLPGSTQKISFKDPGGGYMMVYDEINNTKPIIHHYTGPKWYTLEDEDLSELTDISDNNYIRLCLSCDNILDIYGIKRESLNRFKGIELEIDVSRISAKNLKRIDTEIEVEDPSVILSNYISQQDIDSDKKQKLIQKGQELLNRI